MKHSLKNSYTGTIAASFAGYVVQAVVNCFTPLLYITFGTQYGIGLDRISLLISINFGTQLLIDLLFSQFGGKLSYRFSVVTAHGMAALGMVGLAFFPERFPTPFAGLAAATLCCAVGGGLIEVLISPIVEACPTKNKKGIMSLLHSFYCWGQVAVVGLSTLWFSTVGIGQWKTLTLIWGLLPLVNGILFCLVPLRTLEESTGEEIPKRALIRNSTFWLLMLLMICAGAAEQAMSQWASAFAEKGLGISKSAGDLAGTMMFAVMMGLARIAYAKMSKKISLRRCMIGCGILGVCAYFLAAFSPVPLLGLSACGLCGLSVGVLWPGTYNLASEQLRGGGTAMFALLALAGDLGCVSGPALVGLISDRSGGTLKTGLSAAAVFPALLIGALLLLGAKKKK